MYYLIPIPIVLLFVLFLLNYHRKKQAAEKISRMSYRKKCDLLNELAKPYGFSYQFVQDIFTARDDTWQKELGYEESLAASALSMHMVLDCEPVYFNYQGKTWLIEFRKGQYGINTGAEAGFYHADTVIPPALRPQTVFKAISDKEMLPVKLRLIGPDCPFFTLSQKHWWAAGFVMGIAAPPDDLILEVTLSFPEALMCRAFVRAMQGLGYKSSELLVSSACVQFYFTRPKAAPLVPPDPLKKKYMLFQNRTLCDLFLWTAEPFFTTVDRLLYLNETHPFLFRRLLVLRTFQKHRRWKK